MSRAEQGATESGWWTHKERGTRFALTLIVWIVRHLGRGAGYLSLYPICLYYMLFSPSSVRASRHFLGKVWGCAPAWRDIFKHHYVFAATLLDRVHMLAGDHRQFSVSVHGYEHLARFVEAGRGCIVLGAHLGSFEAMRALAWNRNIPVKAMMFQHNARGFQKLGARLNAELAECIIEIGRPNTLLKVKEALEAGACVGILGDRALQTQDHVACEFLGEAAPFPVGPYRLAELLHAPIVLFFGLYTGRGCYDVYFEPLAKRHAERSNSADSRRADAAAYAQRLEHYARLAPFNWFNFYDFWRRGE